MDGLPQSYVVKKGDPNTYHQSLEAGNQVGQQKAKYNYEKGTFVRRPQGMLATFA